MNAVPVNLHYKSTDRFPGVTILETTKDPHGMLLSTYRLHLRRHSIDTFPRAGQKINCTDYCFGASAHMLQRIPWGGWTPILDSNELRAVEVCGTLEGAKAAAEAAGVPAMASFIFEVFDLCFQEERATKRKEREDDGEWVLLSVVSSCVSNLNRLTW